MLKFSFQFLTPVGPVTEHSLKHFVIMFTLHFRNGVLGLCLQLHMLVSRSFHINE